jgi:hypothetical protein
MGRGVRAPQPTISSWHPTPGRLPRRPRESRSAILTTKPQSAGEA